jgi:hypothetical protein
LEVRALSTTEKRHANPHFIDDDNHMAVAIGRVIYPLKLHTTEPTRMTPP